MYPQKLNKNDHKQIITNAIKFKFKLENDVTFNYDWGSLHVAFMFDNKRDFVANKNVEHFWNHKVSEEDKIDCFIMFKNRFHACVNSKFYPQLQNKKICEMLPSAVKGVKALLITIIIKDLEAFRSENIISPEITYNTKGLGERYKKISSVVGTQINLLGFAR